VDARDRFHGEFNRRDRIIKRARSIKIAAFGIPRAEQPPTLPSHSSRPNGVASERLKEKVG